jgi:hypothetical protein
VHHRIGSICFFLVMIKACVSEREMRKLLAYWALLGTHLSGLAGRLILVLFLAGSHTYCVIFDTRAAGLDEGDRLSPHI